MTSGDNVKKNQGFQKLLENSITRTF